MSNAIDEKRDEDQTVSAGSDVADTPNPTAGETDSGAARDPAGATAPRSRGRLLRFVALFAAFAAVAGTITFLAVGLSHQNRATDLRAEYLETARGGALNLLNVSFGSVDQDVDRLLGNASGAFEKDFGGNADNYKSVVKQAQVTSSGEVVQAAVENVTDSGATVLIAAQAKITNLSVPDGEPRSYRLRVSVAKDGDRLTISDVQFVA